MNSFALNPEIDVASLADSFRRRGRIRIQPFLEEKSAERLLEHLESREDWRLVINAGEKVFEIDRQGQRDMDSAARRDLDAKIVESASRGFQFRFETIRVPDDEQSRVARGTLLDEFARFLSGPPVRDLLRQITGSSDIDFADAQATVYGRGDFLTMHDDAVDGKGRRAAYVLGLTEEWRADWGGLLMFHGDDGDIEEAWIPRFNALSLFAVPQRHSVGLVAPFAAAKRYSVTGWLRTFSLTR